MIKRNVAIRRVESNPLIFSHAIELINSVNEKQQVTIDSMKKLWKERYIIAEANQQSIHQLHEAFMAESRATSRLRSKMVSLDALSESNEKEQREETNYIAMINGVFTKLALVYESLYASIEDLEKPALPTKIPNISDDKTTSIKNFLQITQMYAGPINEYIGNILKIINHRNTAYDALKEIALNMELYYRFLLQRHGSDGIKIYINPVLTDVALRIYENIDSHGEIDSGREKDKISAYTIRKAQILAKVLEHKSILSFIKSPDLFFQFIKDQISMVDAYVGVAEETFAEQIRILKHHFRFEEEKRRPLGHVMDELMTFNPANIVYSEPIVILSPSDRMMNKIKSDTLEKMTAMINEGTSDFNSLINFVLDRKAELKRFFHEENNFYICKIGGGNPWSGQAPGGLYVTPAERPTGDFREIVGSGFDEVKEFLDSTEMMKDFSKLFLATSPSKSTDKSNVLLVGPQGCGKTEILRALACNRNSIGVFAQGSDFLTCWAGEAHKNPKRMFEEGLKLSIESKKHVYFLIDEADAVMNNDSENTKMNLTLEFQILMDGLVSYPGLSVWGATNRLDRIPLPIMRRFHKVLVVGELDRSDRIKLLKYFMKRLPVAELSESMWEVFSDQLDGATGDVVRKVTDLIWRDKISGFITKNPEAARKVLEHVVALEKPEIFDYRPDFRDDLAKHIMVTKEDIGAAIRKCITNVAISHEIRTAVETYQKAKDYLKSLDK